MLITRLATVNWRMEGQLFGSQNDATARLGFWAQAAEDSAR